jgi:hypothetical protein
VKEFGDDQILNWCMAGVSEVEEEDSLDEMLFGD